MAIYHYSAKVIGRSTGRSVTAAAAYRAGVDIYDSTTGLDHKYSRRGGIIESEILTPEDAPDWATDRAKLWNTVEAKETRKDAQLAREVEVSL
ncbi:MAG: MobA/MobL family protein, partial [Nitrospira sp.]|nr:MobA/MobL family protein [Nitrospira sp.]